jgi:hypothetical protein
MARSSGEFRVESSEFRKCASEGVILNVVKDLHRSNAGDPSLGAQDDPDACFL